MLVGDEERLVSEYKDDLYSCETAVRAMPSAWGFGEVGESGENLR